MVPGGFFWFSRFKVGFHDSRWVFMVIYGSRLFFMVHVSRSVFYGSR